MRHYLIFGDTHHPFHNQKCIDLMLMVADDLYQKGALDEIIANGDIADFLSLSLHPKDPSIQMEIRDEQVSVAKFLKGITGRYPKTKRVFITGNHENRLRRFLAKNAPELYDLFCLPEFLGTTLYDWDFIPYAPTQAYQIEGTNIVVRHEGVSNGVNASRMSAVNASCGVIFSHTHRMSSSLVKTLDKRVLEGINIGCLCDYENLDAPFSYVTRHHDWQYGFLLLTVIEGQAYPRLIRINRQREKYRCVADGVFYEI